MNVQIYTDGACSGNPGPGGWAAVLISGEHRLEISGYEPDTTNNRMELRSVIEALKALRHDCDVDLYSDSSYVVHAFTQHWIESWQRKNWMRTPKDPVLNQDLWKELISYTERHRVTFHLVKGHANNKENNRCDELATRAVKERSGVRS
jgi:ribonuclease HI